MKSKNTKKPFFSRYLETQDLGNAAGGAPAKFEEVTMKYPSDEEDGNLPVTLKYPFDQDSL